MNYFKSTVKYLQTSKQSSEFGASCVFAAYFAGSSIFPKAVNWRQADTTALGLYLVNVYLLISPVLSHIMLGTFGSGQVLVSKHTIRTLSSFSPLSKGDERFEFTSELETLEDAHSYLDRLIAEIEGIAESNTTFGYALPFLVDVETRRVVLSNLLVQLRCYRECRTAAKLGLEIGVSLSRLHALPGFPESDSDITSAFDFTESRAVSAPYGVRKYVPMANNRVAFSGDPSVGALSLTQLFIREVSVVYSDGETVKVVAPTVGCSIVRTETLSQGQWLRNLFTSTTLPKAAGSPVLKESKGVATCSEVVEEPRVVNRLKKGGSGVTVTKPSGTREYSSQAIISNPSPNPGGWMYHYDGKQFRLVGRL